MPLEVRNISFGIIRDLSFEIKDGSMTALMGAAGSGKSTLLNLLSALDEPDAGALLLDGKAISKDKSAIRKNVGIVFQESEKQLFATTVEEDIAFVLRKEKISKEERRKRVLGASDLAALDQKLLSASPLTLSGGERRKAAIAGILAARPRFLLLDEPLAGLDAASRSHLLESLRKLNQNGTAILMVTHSPDEAALFKDLLVMRKGRLIYKGDARTLLSDNTLAERAGIKATSAAVLRGKLNTRGFTLPPVLTPEELAAALKEVL